MVAVRRHAVFIPCGVFVERRVGARPVGYGPAMTTTPSSPEPDVVPSGDPEGVPTPEPAPGEDPGVPPERPDAEPAPDPL